MWPDRVLNTGPLALELDALMTALCGLATMGSELFPLREAPKRMELITSAPSISFHHMQISEDCYGY